MLEDPSITFPTRRVTREDKDAAAEELLPHLQGLNKRQTARLKQLFGDKHRLNPTQVELILLEVKRRKYFKDSSEE